MPGQDTEELWHSFPRGLMILWMFASFLPEIQLLPNWWTFFRNLIQLIEQNVMAEGIDWLKNGGFYCEIYLWFLNIFCVSFYARGFMPAELFNFPRPSPGPYVWATRMCVKKKKKGEININTHTYIHTYIVWRESFNFCNNFCFVCYIFYFNSFLVFALCLLIVCRNKKVSFCVQHTFATVFVVFVVVGAVAAFVGFNCFVFLATSAFWVQCSVCVCVCGRVVYVYVCVCVRLQFVIL